jgi:hypothetical protein
VPLLALSVLLSISGGPPRVAIPPWHGVNLEPDAVAFFSNHFAQRLREAGIPVSTSSEIEAVIGLERTKQMLGCTDDSSSCFTEVAAAIGTEAIAVGSVGRFGTAYQVDVKILRVVDGRSVAAASARTASERELIDALSEMAKSMAMTLGVRQASGRPRSVALIPAVGAVLSGVAAGVCLGLARSEYSALASAPVSGQQELPFATADSYRRSGPLLLWSGLAAAGVALAAVILADVLWFSSEGH